MSINSLHQFVTNSITYQNQAMFEFRYPVLFEDDSFLIEQLNFPKVDSNVGYVYLDGYKFPVHSTALFDNEITFTMYVDEQYLLPSGKYYKIFNALLADDHVFNDITDKVYEAKIYPLSTNIEEYLHDGPASHLFQLSPKREVVLKNALIKSISMAGGFSSNSTALAKFDVVMTYAYLHHDKSLEKVEQMVKKVDSFLTTTAQKIQEINEKNLKQAKENIKKTIDSSELLTKGKEFIIENKDTNLNKVSKKFATAALNKLIGR